MDDMFDSSKVFSVLDGYGMNTLAFQINSTLVDGELVSSIEKLKAFLEQDGEGFRKTFFFNPEPMQDERKEVVFLTLKPGEAVLNGGEFFNGKLTVGKRPSTIKYSALRVGSVEEEKEYEYMPNLKRQISIIDTELGDEVRPSMFYDIEKDKRMARIRLKPNKSYIALEVR